MEAVTPAAPKGGGAPYLRKRGLGLGWFGGLGLCLAALVLGPAWAQEPGPAGRAARLLGRLQQGGDVTVVAFGDSLTAGWGTDGRHVYHRLVADTLRYAFPRSHVELLVRGHPGETTAGALRRLSSDAVAAGPDLLLVQFGGNDKGTGRPVGAFRQDFGRLLRRAREETQALVIACLPPIVDDDPANEWNEAARQVAAAEGVPAADLDRAIREGDADFRGPFPYGSHPGSFTHVIMAKEVLRALREALGIREAFAGRFRTGSWLSAKPGEELEAEVSSLADTAVDCVLQTECAGVIRADTVRLEGRKSARVKRPIALPTQPVAGRSYGFPVHLLARGGGFGGMDVCWLVVAPAVSADTVGGRGLDTEALTWHGLGAECFTLGRQNWWGAEDLGCRFAVAASPDRLTFLIEVTDDDLTVADGQDPSQGDSVELYLDLRTDADQGKPVYGAEVLALQITPRATAGGPGRWRTMQPLPARLRDLVADCVRTPTGYRARVELPLAAVKACRGAAWQGLGFDVGVNDADLGGMRKSQMMWAGIADNYLNPAYLAGLYVEDLPPGTTRRTLR
jgi:lysophospholipase L1-like esterase